MDESPIAQLLGAIDKLDLEAAAALFARDARLLSLDGRSAMGIEAVRELLAEFLDLLRSSAHRITAQWHQQNVWIAEVEATYELQDFLKMKALPRAFVLRDGPDGIADLRIYGAHEHPLGEERTESRGIRIGERWIPPL